jgi:RNA polymerase sigma-70 factor (ECF subfamily)
VFRRHADTVYRLAHRLLGSGADADDVVQETFIEVFRSIHRYRGEASLSSWLHRIAVRTAGHHRKRIRRHAPRLHLVPKAGEERDPETDADGRRVTARVEALLDRLAESRRAVFVLHEVEGYSLPETAALLGISVTAAKKRVWRARRDLERLARTDPMLASFFSPEQWSGDGPDGETG